MPDTFEKIDDDTVGITTIANKSDLIDRRDSFVRRIARLQANLDRVNAQLNILN